MMPSIVSLQAKARRGQSLRSVPFGFVLLGLIILVSLIGPFLVPFNPEAAQPLKIMQPPSAEHVFGTNSYGADVLARVIYAGRLDLMIAICSVGGGLLLAMPIGSLLGYSQGWWNSVTMRVLDFIQSFPPFILAMALAAVAGPSVTNVIMIIGLLNIPVFARLIRAEVMAYRKRAFVEAARCTGNSDLRLISLHILPNTLSAAIAQASVNVGWALILTAGLSFVGAGVEPPTPEWGAMISEGASYMITGQWWIAFFPGLALALAVLSFALVGETISKWFNVRR